MRVALDRTNLGWSFALGGVFASDRNLRCFVLFVLRSLDGEMIMQLVRLEDVAEYGNSVVSQQFGTIGTKTICCVGVSLAGCKANERCVDKMQADLPR